MEKGKGLSVRGPGKNAIITPFKSTQDHLNGKQVVTQRDSIPGFVRVFFPHPDGSVRAKEKLKDAG